MNRRVFISDLHLAPERPAIIDLFVRFCDEVAAQSESLYILGDFVEYWLGDDDEAIGLQPAFDALKRLGDAGCSVFFMHGNRDFLIGETLAQRCGFKLIADPTLIQVGDEPVLLMHGDTLCTDDTDYMKFRETVRNPVFQQNFLNKSLDERQQIAQSMRESSKQATAQKNPEIMDVNQKAVESAMLANKVHWLVHGHTHRPAIHQLEINGQACRRIVLGDWYEAGSYLVLDELSSPRLINYL